MPTQIFHCCWLCLLCKRTKHGLQLPLISLKAPEWFVFDFSGPNRSAEPSKESRSAKICDSYSFVFIPRRQLYPNEINPINGGKWKRDCASSGSRGYGNARYRRPEITNLERFGAHKDHEQLLISFRDLIIPSDLILRWLNL